MKVHTGDSVLVIAGKDKGKQGTIMHVLETKNRLIIEGINMRVRHIKKTTQQAGQRIKYEASISASNVMLLDPKTKKPTRVGYRIDAKGKKVRFAKVSGEVLPIVSTVKAAAPKKAAKAAKSTEETKATSGKSKETSSTSSQSSSSSPSSPSSPPAKQPFWKRAFSAGPATEEGNAPSGKEASGPSTVAPVRRSRESNG